MITLQRTVFLLLMMLPSIGFAAAQALLDRDRINLYETVNLELSTDKSGDQAPDLSPLNADFDIASTGKTVSMEMINGQVKHETRWVVSLNPKRAGTITIPALNFGDEKTAPVQLTVLQKPAPQQEAEDFFIETSVEPKEAYLQQQLLYTMRIWTSRPLANARYMPPTVNDGANLTPIDKEINSTTNRAGRQYEVIEKHYLISPEKVGTLTINPPVLHALTLDQHQLGDFYGGTNTHSVHAAGKTLTLMVKPKPAAWQETRWLPATRLTLKEEWGKDLKNWHVGEPMTRSITLQAWGISAEQLPPIKIDSPQGINAYQDKSESNNKIDQHTILGTRRTKVALVPTQAGDWQLPPIKIHWWNVKTHKPELAELPAITVKILPEVGASGSAATPLVVPDKNQSHSQHQFSSESNANDQLASQWLIWLLAGLLLFSFLAIVFLWRKLRSTTSTTKQEPFLENKSEQSLRQAINAIKKSCSQNDPRTTIDATLAWARKQWPTATINSLQDLTSLIHHPEFIDQIAKLLAACYGHERSSWNADQYAKVFQKYVAAITKDKPKPEDFLPSLYP